MTKMQGEIHSISGPREFNGQMQVGFILKGYAGQWYNMPGEEEALEVLKKTVLQKGAEISFECNEKRLVTGSITLIAAPKKQEEGKNWSEEITSFRELLASAHKNFGEKMHMRVDFARDGEGKPMVDFEKKIAVFKAQVYIRRDDKNTQVFEAHGDAIGDNVSGEKIKPHWLRMGETRAYVRALRFATNDASVAIEETSEESEDEKD